MLLGLLILVVVILEFDEDDAGVDNTLDIDKAFELDGLATETIEPATLVTFLFTKVSMSLFSHRFRLNLKQGSTRASNVLGSSNHRYG